MLAKFYDVCGVSYTKKIELISFVQEMHGRERLEIRLDRRNCTDYSWLFENNKLRAWDLRVNIPELCFDGFLVYAEVHREYILLAFAGMYEYMKTKLSIFTGIDWDAFYAKRTVSYSALDTTDVIQDFIGEFSYIVYKPDPVQHSNNLNIYYFDSNNTPIFLQNVFGSFEQTINIPLPNNGVRFEFIAGGASVPGQPQIYTADLHYSTAWQILQFWNGPSIPPFTPYLGYTNGGSQYHFTIDSGEVEFGDLDVSYGTTMADILDQVNENGYEWTVDGFEIKIQKKVGTKYYKTLTSKNSDIQNNVIIYDGSKIGNWAHNTSDDSPLATTEFGFSPIISSNGCSNGEAYGLLTDTNSQQALDAFLNERTADRLFTVVMGDWYNFCDIKIGDEVLVRYKDCDSMFDFSDCYRVISKEYGIRHKLTLSKDIFEWRNRENRQRRRLYYSSG